MMTVWVPVQWLDQPKKNELFGGIGGTFVKCHCHPACHQMSVAMTDPWDERYIYLHESHTNQLNVGEYTVRPMDPMGYDTEQK